MGYLDENGLARYDGLVKNWVTFKSGTVDGIDSLLNWQKTETAGAVACYPLPAAPIDPVVNFAFTETGPASGTKGPDNPSTIMGVESVKVWRCGKNLVSKITPQTRTNNGVTFTVDSQGFVTTSGTATGGNANFFYDMPPNALDIPVVKGHTYTISGCPQDGSSSTYCMTTALFNKNGSVISYNVLNDTGNGKTWTATDDGYFWVVILIGNGYDSTGLVFKPQIEESSTATSYEPPEHNLYTISLNDTFYGGSVDLSAGTMTVTHEHIILTGDNANVNFSDNIGTYNKFYIDSVNNKSIKKAAYNYTNPQFCTHFVYNYDGWNLDAPHFYSRRVNPGYVYFYSDCANIDAFKTWLTEQYQAGTPVEVVYPISAPYTVQLTPTQIYSLSYSNLYTPCINTIYSDQQSIQVGYPKSPQAMATELTNAIVSLGGNI